MDTNSQMASIVDPSLFLITGIMAAGKSAVAQQLAEKLPQSVHLRGDLFRRMIINGQANMGLTLSPEAYGQLRLRYQIAAAAAHLYLEAGFTVVYQDIIIGAELAQVLQLYTGQPLYVVVLCPAPEVVTKREAGRGKIGYTGFGIAEFDQIFRAETPRIGLWLDNSDLTVSETVNTILANLSEAKVSHTT